jgi:hypothetical protein
MKTVIYKFGFYASLTAFLAAVGYSIAQLLQVFNVIHFPLADILIYAFSLCIAAPFMLAILALHHSVSGRRKIWSHTSLLLAILYTVYASFVYVVQLATVVPRMTDSPDSVRLLVMNPHSFLWSLDALTYICLGVSTFFGAFAFERTDRNKIIRWFFLSNALMTPITAFVYFYPQFSTSLLWIGSPWIITAPGSMLLMAIYFRRKRNSERIEVNHQAELVEVWAD